MAPYKELTDRLKALQPTKEIFVSGVVVSVDGCTCMVEVGSSQIEASLRPTEMEQSGELLLIPKVGSAVVLASMNGDYSSLVVLSCDVVEKVLLSGELIYQSAKITINDGSFGGLIKIKDLTEKLNALVDAFNTHTHPHPQGPTSAPQQQAQSFAAADYEDTSVTH